MSDKTKQGHKMSGCEIQNTLKKSQPKTVDDKNEYRKCLDLYIEYNILNFTSFASIKIVVNLSRSGYSKSFKRYKFIIIGIQVR